MQVQEVQDKEEKLEEILGTLTLEITMARRQSN